MAIIPDFQQDGLRTVDTLRSSCRCGTDIGSSCIPTFRGSVLAVASATNTATKWGFPRRSGNRVAMERRGASLKFAMEVWYDTQRSGVSRSRGAA